MSLSLRPHITRLTQTICRQLRNKQQQQQQQRHITTSISVNKRRYKYSLDPTNLSAATSGAYINGRSNSSRRRKGVYYVDGEVVSCFELDTPEHLDINPEEVLALGPRSKQSQISKLVHPAVETLLASSKCPREVRDCAIQIVKVDVNTRMRGATIYWTNTDESKYTEYETTDILQQHLSYLQTLFPSFVTKGKVPRIRFAPLYDQNTKEREEAITLLNTTRKQTDKLANNIT